MRYFTVGERLAAQCGVVAVWQLVGDGRTRGEIRSALGGMRELHHGVFVSGHAPVTDQQRWIAAAVTAPRTVVDRWSGLAAHGIREERRGSATCVVRPGSGGPEVVGGWDRPVAPIEVARSTRMGPDVVWVGAIPVFSPARCVLRVFPDLGDDSREARLVRDVIRLRKATPVDLRMVAARQHGDRGVARLKALVDRYRPLPLEHTKSDAEALALEILHSAGVARPVVNGMVAGEEADLCWPHLMRIIELDGPSFHQFPHEDQRKQRVWEAAGFAVIRLPTDDVYHRPHRLLAAAPPPTLAPSVEQWLQ